MAKPWMPHEDYGKASANLQLPILQNKAKTAQGSGDLAHCRMSAYFMCLPERSVLLLGPPLELVGGG